MFFKKKKKNTNQPTKWTSRITFPFQMYLGLNNYLTSTYEHGLDALGKE